MRTVLVGPEIEENLALGYLKSKGLVRVYLGIETNSEVGIQP